MAKNPNNPTLRPFHDKLTIHPTINSSSINNPEKPQAKLGLIIMIDKTIKYKKYVPFLKSQTNILSAPC